MKERPILFSAPMIRALLEGRKSQTRRAMNPQPANGWALETPPVFGRITSSHPKRGRFGVFLRRGQGTDFPEADLAPCPYGQPGGRLWVRETWRPRAALSPWDLEITYAADGVQRLIQDGEFGDRDWTMPKAAERGNVSPLFMPRWASRITLEVTDVRVERLQAISENDAHEEGCSRKRAAGCPVVSARDEYRELWESINGAGSWAANPWVWVVSFRRVTP